MIEFLTIFFGLISGPQMVEMAVLGEVATIELRLDGAMVRKIEAPPWKAEIDLGEALRPRRLEAIARGAGGEEMARVEQVLNVPTSEAQMRIMLEPQLENMPRRGRLLWLAASRERPVRVLAELDGTPLSVQAMRAFTLPPMPLDDTNIHILSASAEFPAGASAHATLLLGGRFNEQADSDLTHVPVLLEAGVRLPEPERLLGWVRKGQAAVPVRAVEDRRAEVIVVRDRGAWEELRDLGHRFRDPKQQKMGMLGPRRTLRLLDAVPEKAAGSDEALVFPLSQTFTEGDGGFPWLVGYYHKEETLKGRAKKRHEAQQLVDAVATAGLRISSSHGARAIVLILGETGKEDNQWSIPAVRDYLHSLAIPLYVWSPLKGERQRQGLESGWGEVRDISTPSLYLDAVGQLVDELQRQKVLWVEGTHFLHDLTLGPRAAGVRFPGH